MVNRYSPLPLEYGGARPSPSFESDARMVYCASVIMDWISIVHPELGWTEKEKEETQGWIRRCQVGPLGRFGSRCGSRGGGTDSVSFGTVELGRRVRWKTRFRSTRSVSSSSTPPPRLKAHPVWNCYKGGTTYCCITANALLTQNQPDTPLYDQPAASRWLTQRQVAQGEGGFQGRPGKDEDVCYSFWCGAGSRVSPRSSLASERSGMMVLIDNDRFMQVLTGEAMFNTVDNTSALLNAQSPVGGFGKAKGEYPGESGFVKARLLSRWLTVLPHRSVSFLLGPGGFIDE
jgi:prenyltransferase beta subunit